MKKMDANQFLTNIIENMIVATPQFIMILGALVYNLKSIKKKTEDFPMQVQDTKTVLKNQFNQTKEDITKSFFEAKDLIVDTLKQSKEEMNAIVKDVTQQIHDSVNVAMESMQEELNQYKEQIISSKEQTNMVVREAKAFMEVITILVSKDPKLIRDGVSTVICSRLNMTKEELEKLPQEMMKEGVVLEQAMKEAIILLGKEKFDELLERIGYEAKTEEIEEEKPSTTE
jgi:hypothetical protein